MALDRFYNQFQHHNDDNALLDQGLAQIFQHLNMQENHAQPEAIIAQLEAFDTQYSQAITALNTLEDDTRFATSQEDRHTVEYVDFIRKIKREREILQGRRKKIEQRIARLQNPNTAQQSARVHRRLNLNLFAQ